ncbi:MAG: hypothetical protein GTO55_11740 [Armatimonadetes bacterium]|nr:hypothetical protein [Armatimonadota bacterium]NIM24888.1 hypothetical protein [Armatimonadota bacterium]NIM68777.1 hypothetical protein [Armatimonadota bacterium]NIM77039.1 hypothetical protein [Armatimonadota bacterium]NIN06974.1 hypothetical protein [Armatimonadota bacterium]
MAAPSFSISMYPPLLCDLTGGYVVSLAASDSIDTSIPDTVTVNDALQIHSHLPRPQRRLLCLRMDMEKDGRISRLFAC